MTLFTEIVERSEAQKADIAWFQSHPIRSHRFRGTTPAEKAELADCVPPGGVITHVVVRQLEPGVNVRRPLNFSTAQWPFIDFLCGDHDIESLRQDFLISELFENNEILRDLKPLMARALAKLNLAGRA